jgi:hypothetical protein
VGHFLSLLAETDSAYEEWYVEEDNACRIYPASAAPIQEVLKRGRFINDDGQEIPQLGWQLRLSNGREGPENRSLSIHCGSWSVAGNACVLEARYSSLELALPTLQVARNVIISMALAWSADWAKVSDFRIMGEIDKADPTALDGYQPGWVMYRRLGIAEDVVWPPECERVKAPDAEGELIIASRTPEEASSREGINRLLRIGRALAASKNAASFQDNQGQSGTDPE